jgi:hypothetical protein
MPLVHAPQKVERITISLVPTGDDRSFENVPTTFSTLHRSYEWRRASQMRYMIVPRKVSSNEILIDFFVEPATRGANSGKLASRFVDSFIQHKIGSEWKGLKLGTVGRPTAAHAPQKAFVRGTIEEMLGAKLVR